MYPQVRNQQPSSSSAMPTAPSAAQSLPTSRIELRISCKGLPKMDYLSKSDPQVILYTRDPDSNVWHEHARTEVIWDCHEPSFVKPFLLDYTFSMEQPLRFLVLDIDNDKSSRIEDQDSIGSVELTLAAIVSARSRLVERRLAPATNRIADAGSIVIQAEELSDSKKLVKLRLSAFNLKYRKFLFMGSCLPFFRILRSAESGTYATVYESPILPHNPAKAVWPGFEIPMNTLCNGDNNRELVVQVLNRKSNGDHELIGSAHTSVAELVRLSDLRQEPPHGSASRVSSGSLPRLSELELQLDRHTTGVIVVNQCVIEQQDSFLDYVRGGMQMSLVVAVDFTSSNGDPRHPDSLHFRNPTGGMNEYQKAIVAVGGILEAYDTDKRFPVYGFGGYIEGETRHCFPLNFDPKTPEVEGVRGILNAYNLSLDVAQLSGPTYFSPVINQTASLLRQDMQQRAQGHVNYHVLLILTDGVITDMKETVRSIVQASNLPLSIVIVGVGSADFAAMEVLDADDAPLVADGVRMHRDIVQFVPFRQFQGVHNHRRLAEAVLDEIPQQVLDYMKEHRVRPGAPPPLYTP
ncbi:hypothetical protein RI367_002810 [Sorochytrium milnesiophthora]